MMSSEVFDFSSPDSQATAVSPVLPEEFDFDAYMEYEHNLLPACKQFCEASCGVLVHRRFRVAEVFGSACGDMELSLSLQLGALRESMEYKSDIPNFLEPWYGFGCVASAFGGDYAWHENQAPAILSPFDSVGSALNCDCVPVDKSIVGRRTLEMIEYFLDKTGGQLPMSLCDIESPLDNACNILDSTSFFMSVIDSPAEVKMLLERLAGMTVEFVQKQVDLIGRSLAWPGHGFSSCRNFAGLGMGDDNSIMISAEQYSELASDAFRKTGIPFGGTAFHSCGNWGDKAELIRNIDGVRMVDGAFSAQTDPSPNVPENFVESFCNSGIIVNARIVGSPDTVCGIVKRLWQPGMKLIVVTYCKTPQEQAEAYDRIHQICC
jgi:hypothetical protein